MRATHGRRLGAARRARQVFWCDGCARASSPSLFDGPPTADTVRARRHRSPATPRQATDLARTRPRQLLFSATCRSPSVASLTCVVPCAQPRRPGRAADGDGDAPLHPLDRRHHVRRRRRDRARLGPLASPSRLALSPSRSPRPLHVRARPRRERVRTWECARALSVRCAPRAVCMVLSRCKCFYRLSSLPLCLCAHTPHRRVTRIRARSPCYYRARKLPFEVSTAVETRVERGNYHKW